MPIEIAHTELPDVLLIKPCVFGDSRGFFYESFNKRDWFDSTGIDSDFVQDNHSRSVKDVLRGLHYQLPAAAQGKLIRVTVGEIFDVAVDIRRHSQTFGKWMGQRLSAKNLLQMWLPEGFAHGFLVLSDVAEVQYKTTSYYAPEYERTILWNDSTLDIKWPLSGLPQISKKDSLGASFMSSEFFEKNER